ncbi:hypothetical protein HanXRQr2_Chr04g0162951 [Helianthus annuus]|uniref:Uncharacterized protein n=1 Tax=Helianthus annuus TaxID=4232 RepID=A0A9K3J8U1_HELAN|nr:hypothetical protein HanXRQr2_Chr04g0162951 [Helianthus annuus]KAJ0931063.1 hypothetical protein HanPSC8_Chr04g0157041 [Helianthus annuus]
MLLSAADDNRCQIVKNDGLGANEAKRSNKEMISQLDRVVYQGPNKNCSHFS